MPQLPNLLNGATDKVSYAISLVLKTQICSNAIHNMPGNNWSILEQFHVWLYMISTAKHTK